MTSDIPPPRGQNSKYQSWILDCHIVSRGTTKKVFSTVIFLVLSYICDNSIET